MARPRFEKLKPEKQEAFLAAAALEFAERGYEGASLSRILERAGSSKGALYYYFEDKADLLATVLQRAWDRMLQAVRWPSLDEFTAENYWERVRDIAESMMPLLEQDTWYMRIIRSFYRLRDEPAAARITASLVERSRMLVRAFLQHGRDLGVVRSDLPLELLVEVYLAADQAGDRWLLRHWDGFDEREKHAFVAARVELARDMLGTGQSGRER